MTLCKDVIPKVLLVIMFPTSLKKHRHNVIDEGALPSCHHLLAPTCLVTTGDSDRVCSARSKLFMGCRHPPRGERDTNYVL